MLLEYYSQILAAHVASVALSGALFMLRGVLIQFGAKRVAMATPTRYASYTIDLILLVSALLLVAILPWVAFSNGWLLVKIILVLVYVVLGTLALKRGRTARVRALCYLAALATFLFIVGIAIAHQPLGWLYLWFA